MTGRQRVNHNALGVLCTTDMSYTIQTMPWVRIFMSSTQPKLNIMFTCWEVRYCLWISVIVHNFVVNGIQGVDCNGSNLILC